LIFIFVLTASLLLAPTPHNGQLFAEGTFLAVLKGDCCSVPSSKVSLQTLRTESASSFDRQLAVALFPPLLLYVPVLPLYLSLF
jgi:hypothetical protein